ncbi:hypothetical protein MUK42_14340, partial [Musa troglodytarum]
GDVSDALGFENRFPSRIEAPSSSWRPAIDRFSWLSATESRGVRLLAFSVSLSPFSSLDGHIFEGALIGST